MVMIMLVRMSRMSLCFLLARRRSVMAGTLFLKPGVRRFKGCVWGCWRTRSVGAGRREDRGMSLELREACQAYVSRVLLDDGIFPRYSKYPRLKQPV